MAFPSNIPPSASTTLNPITKLILSRLQPTDPIVYPVIWIIDLQPGERNLVAEGVVALLGELPALKIAAWTAH
jgi:hypothetical protein